MQRQFLIPLTGILFLLLVPARGNRFEASPQQERSHTPGHLAEKSLNLFNSDQSFPGLSLSAAPGMAQHHPGGHDGPAPSSERKTEPSPGREASSTRAFLLEGVKATFSIVSMAEHKKMLEDMKMKVEGNPQATHNIAVSLTETRSNQPLRDAVVKMKVIGPKGATQVKLLDFIMGMNQYAENFTLAEKGRYQILILFKAGGKKQAAGFHYLLK